MSIADLPVFNRLLSPTTRIEIAVRTALASFTDDGLLPGIRLYLGESFCKPPEPFARAEARWVRHLDGIVRRVIREHRLPEQAPPTVVSILDTTNQSLVAVRLSNDLTGVSQHSRRIVDVACLRLPTGRAIEVKNGGILGGPTATSPVLSIPIAGISSRHAQVSVIGGVVTVRDLGSRNGTRIGRQEVHDEPTILAPGQILLLANAKLQFIEITRRFEAPTEEN